MNDDNLHQRLRAADPATNLAADPHDAIAQRIRSRALASGAARSVPRARVVGSAAAALLLLSTVTAVAAGVFEPDEEAVATILNEAEESGAAKVKTDDWRPTLRTERVICAHEDGTLGSTTVAHAEEFPIDEGLDDEALIAACARGTDQTRQLETPEEFTICAGAVVGEDVEHMVEQLTGGEGPIEGDVTSDRPQFPVVLGWETDCTETSIETSPERTDLAPWTSDSLENLNRAREIEIGLTAAAIDDCLSADDALELANAARQDLAGDWLVVAAEGFVIEDDQSNGCAEVRLDGQSRGVIDVGWKA